MTEVLRCFSRVDLVGTAPSVVRNDCTVTLIAPTPPNHATSGQEVACPFFRGQFRDLDDLTRTIFD